ncbi:putative bifunctional diguanylate cyclase/phosphodiesterase [Mycolicibacterium vinylchloridicum]|uniref:putative bifunctional diguanylate cyclase/phosphodiesterase n=1 Tax=Mycolicibacterium vinylchloridicum TaxID=2736928 RepID=UPI0015CED320|nr:bifunctional diguanylate cyclase/phosphodiesterase [Mycolicibacterium vinylchloridicum]
MFVALVVVILLGWLHGSTLAAVADFVFVALTIPAASFAVLAARSRSGRLRLAWLSLAAGIAGWGVGEAIWAFYELYLHEIPSPSFADVGFLLLPIGATGALLLFPVEHSNESRMRLVLDGIIIAGSLFLVSWVLILEPMYLSDPENRLGMVVSLAYPVSDIVILAVAGMVMVRSGDEHRLPLILLTAAIACFAFSDSAFAYLSARGEYYSGSVVDIGWAAGLLLATVAAAAGRDGARPHRDSVVLPGWASVWLPYMPLLVAGIVVAGRSVPIWQTRPVLVVAGLLVVTVLARQFLAVRENRRLVATVAHQAERDSLTGLANRALFHARLRDAMECSGREKVWPGVVSIDINDFKLVNDNLGHPVGDDLLVEVARRLVDGIRAEHTVARLGGDEFAVLVDRNVDAAERVGGRVVEAFDKPFVLAGHELRVRPSVGLAVGGPDETDLSGGELLRRADIAMYTAKRSRFRGVQIYDPSMQLETEAAEDQLLAESAPPGGSAGVRAIQLLGKLGQAIDKGELTLVYQQKIDLRTGEFVGVEALLRWPQSDGSVLMPEEFLPVVRRHGLTGRLTHHVLATALDARQGWHRAGLDVPVAVNVFAPSVANTTGLPATIAQALGHRGLSPGGLTVEITEDMFLDNMERARDVLEQLRHSGIRIAIDDFGSGYSALSYLRDLPIDEVKLDRGFIASIPVDERAAAVVRAVVDLAHVLGLTVVVEGVEDADTAALVRDLGCDVGQGFFFGVPVTPDKVPALVKRSLAGAPAPWPA